MKKHKKSGIAIVGMAFRLPGDLSTPEEFWEALKQGKDLVTGIDETKWSTDRYFHSRKSELGKSYTFNSGVLSRIYEFDANFFGISPREATQMDPQQRLLLEMTWEALESGCQNPQKLEGSNCAVYVGIASNEHLYRYVNDPSVSDAYTMLGNCPSIASNRISYIFDLHGPSMSIDTACSSSMVALHQACNSLWNGEASSAIVGGVNVLLSPTSFIGFAKASMLSPDGYCKSFDEDGKGYVRSEGCVVLFLKPLADAERDGDPIHAVILNSGVNSDGRTNGIALPSADAQAALITQVHSHIGIAADDISYIEAHGTGTPAGDPIEASAIGAAIGQHRTAKNPLLMGSVKSNIGHLEVASGLAGIVKTILCLQHHAVPATVHFNNPNPNINFEQLNLKVVDQLIELPKKDTPAIMAINSFGFGGTNAHALIAEYIPSHEQANKTHHLIPPLVLSARNEKALPELAKQYYELLSNNVDDYYNVAYTLASRRQLHNHGMIIDGDNSQAIIDALKQISLGGADKKQLSNVFEGQCIGKQLTVALVYSGNGSQWQGMGQQLLKQNRLFKQTIEEVDLLFAKYADFSIQTELLADKENSRYHLTEIAQPTLFALQVAVTRYLVQNGVKITAVLGHSVGEIAAAWACGALTLEDAVRVIYERSLWQGKTRGMGNMAAIAMQVESAEKLIADLGLAQELEIAGINSPTGITVAGAFSALQQLQTVCDASNVFYRLLDLDYAFHSQHMESIKEGVLNALADIKPQKNTIQFISTVTGTELSGEKLGADYWWNNIRQPVRFYEAVNTLIDDGVQIFLDVGPHPIMKRYVDDSLAAKEKQGLVIPTIKRESNEALDLKTSLFKTWLSGAQFDIHAWFPTAGRAVSLPSYPWVKESYWLKPSNEHNNQIELLIEHPLLGARIKAGEPVWENHLDAVVVSYLADHLVDGAAVLPATGYVEIALAASKIWYSCDHHDVRDIEIFAPMVFEADYCRMVRFVLQPTDGSFEIKSRIRHSNEPWTLHAVGRLLGEPAYDPKTKINIDSLKNAAISQLSDDAHYMYAEKVRLVYGPTFKIVTNVWIQDSSTTLASVAMHPEIVATLDQYVLHPTLLDACFQLLISLFGYKDPEHSAMLPVRVGRIRIFGKTSEASYMTTKLIKENKQTAVANFFITDKNGSVVAEINDCRVKNVSFINHSNVPKTYTCQPHLLSAYQSQPAISIDDLKLIRALAETAVATTKTKRVQHFDAVMPLFDVMIGQFVYQAIKLLAAEKTSFTLEELSVSGKVIASQQPLLKRCAQILLEDGYLQREGVDGFSFIAEHDNAFDAESIWLTLRNDYPHYLSELVMVGRCGRNLKDILCGALEPQAILNPARKSDTLEHFLEVAPSAIGGHDAICKTIELIVKKWPANRRLRILEIGVGLGNLSTQLINLVPVNKTDYCIAVRDDAAVVKANYFASNYDFVKTIQLNLDEDFTKHAQIAGQSFDLIIVRNCLHDVNDIHQALGELKNSLANDGTLLVAERYCDRMQEIVFGVEPTWWRLQDDGQFSPKLLSDKAWQQLLTQSGFDVVESLYEPAAAEFDGAFVLMAQPSAVEKLIIEEQVFDWLIFADAANDVADLVDALKKKQQSVFVATPQAQETEFSFDLHQPETIQRLLALFADKQATLRVVQLMGVNSVAQQANVQTVMDFQRRCDVIVHLVKAIENLAWTSYPQLTMVTHGAVLCHSNDLCDINHDPEQAPLWGFGRVLMNEHPELRCKLIDLQCDDFMQVTTNIVAELFNGDTENEIIITPDARYGLRIIPTAIQTVLSNQQQDFRLDFSRAGSLKNLNWFPIPEKTLAANELMVKPFASGLNFRDVMYAMGLIPDEAVEDGFAGTTLGLEFAGEVIALGADIKGFSIGDKVLGLAPASFSSRVITKAHALMLLPNDWSFAAAASIPIAFLTACYSMHHLARLQPGERILIHGAAGGVGIAAIQLARHIGAEIYATAGSDEKRDFLALMGIKNIYDSRSLAFAGQIMEDTHGEGVDVVLNCLAGEAINANLAIIKPFGRFLELGKRDFYANSKMGLRPFRKNISYFGIDADQVLVHSPSLSAQLFNEMLALLEQGVLKPIPYTEFAIDSIGDAFRSMQQSRHVGKMIINFENQPRLNFSENKINQSLSLNNNATYLVTGGLGGFGLRTAQWLVEKGARHLVLVGRSGAASDEAKIALAAFKTNGITVHVKSLDITNSQAVNNLLQEIQQQMPVLKGIIHAAAIFDDGLIRNLNAERMQNVLAPKIAGAWNLHNSTLNIPLDFFVVYSSATTLFGNPGQANYVAANAYLESLVCKRRTLGLAGLYVAWGAIDDVGYLARNENVKEMLASKIGAEALTSEQAFNILEQLMMQKHVGISVTDLNLNAMQRFMSGAFAPKFERLLAESDINNDVNNEQQIDIRALISGKSPQEVLAIITEMLTHEIAKILHLPAEKININESLLNIGMDSLMAAELASAIEQRFSIHIPMMALSQGPTITGMAKRIAAQLCKTEEEVDPQNDPNVERIVKTFAQHGENLSKEAAVELVRRANELSQTSADVIA